MAKTNKPNAPADNAQMISLSAEIAIDRLFIDLRNPTFEEVLIFASDVCLRAAAVLKNGCAGENEQEKMCNALAMIAKISTDTVNKPVGGADGSK